ncbi:MAG TPA: dihydroorotase family protein [Candidatus Binatia bacterium]|nr:dihydroorotase family protein [Candidatus Binatia bacterium]
MAVDLVVRNGVVVTPETTVEGGVAIEDGIIVAVGSALPDGEKELDAQGNYIFPGLLDPHVHFRDPGLTYKEDFTTGSTAAVYGGVTSVLDMPNVKPITSTPEQILHREKLLEDKSYVDIMLVGVVVQENPDQIIPMAKAGAIGFKVFLGSTIGNIPPPDDGVLLDALGYVAETGLRIGFHAENDQILQHRIRQLKAAGRTDPLAHLESRPAVAEAESIQRMALFAKYTGAKIHIYHLSSKDGMELIAEYKDKGIDITTETGPHYMFLSDKDYAEMGPVIRMNPPVRSKEHGEALWQGILDGRVDFIADDHSPHTEEEKMRDNIWEAISGFLGVETLMQVTYSESVVKRDMSVNHFVKVCSENGARVWHCYPQKGALLPGSDGDITVFDPNRTWQIDRHQLHSKNRVTPWHLWEGQGLPVGTIVRGQVMMWDREFVAERPGGKLVRPSVNGVGT